ncbi:MAG: hypothetical protein QOE90_1774 [Thermoplasmata archaeon]|nr:hypothetical protein [Thermoplasmata archaeon]
MRIFVDITEPGQLYHILSYRCRPEKIAVQRSILHKRPGLGGRGREKHPFYGAGADYLIADDDGTPACAIERKNLDDLAKAITLDGDPERKPRLFRQIRDLLSHPCPLLLLEGPPSPLYRRVEPAALGFQFWAVRQGISIITSSSPPASAHAIHLMARKLAAELEGKEPPQPQEDPDERPSSERD